MIFSSQDGVGHGFDASDPSFLALSHNTVRGAAGAALLNAELLLARGYLKAR